MTTKTLKAAMDKVAELLRQAQEEIAREVLERVNTIAQMRATLKVGVVGVDAGLGLAIGARSILDRAHRLHGKN